MSEQAKQITASVLEVLGRGGDNLEIYTAVCAALAATPAAEYPETKHERDCLYVASNGPAPCTCKAGIAAERPATDPARPIKTQE